MDHLSSDQNLDDYLLYIGDYTTQFYVGILKKPF